jgi:DTW domain-containing protein YfiP
MFDPAHHLLEGLNPSSTCILFPHKSSRNLREWDSVEAIRNVVVLDCTWFQTDQLLSKLECQGFDRFVRLDDYESLYWRYNHHSDKALSSAEALAYFFREYQECRKLDKHEYDGLMFLYCLNLKIVEQSYRKEGEEGKKSQNEKDKRDHC